MIALSIMIPYPYNISCILIVAGLLFMILFKKVSFIGFSFLLNGLIMFVQGCALPVLIKLYSHFHDAHVYAMVINAVLRMFNISSNVISNNLYVQGDLSLFGFLVTWEQAGFLNIFLFTIPGIGIIIFSGAKRVRRIILFFVLLILFSILRYIFFILLYMNTETVSLFINTYISLITFLPVTIFCYKVFPCDISKVFHSLNKFPALHIIIPAAFFSIFLAFIIGFYDPGTKKSGRIIIDEAHSNWEKTTKPYDTEWFGEGSDYNYYSFFTFLENYYSVKRNFTRITSENLKSCDILIIKTPTESFLPDEIRTIKEFVHSGGGLFLISDHTNVFGMSTVINPIAKQFNMRFRYDATYNLINDSLYEYHPVRYLTHPAIQHMPFFLFATSCTIDASIFTETIITGSNLKAVAADYSQKSFFPANLETTESRFGYFPLFSSSYSGKGRIAVFSDSTVFSNFWVFLTGKPELILGTMEWLNRTNSFLFLKILLLCICILLLLIIIFILRKNPSFNNILLMICYGSLFFIITLFMLKMINLVNYPLPEAKKKYIRVVCEKEYSVFDIPDTLNGFKAPLSNKYHTFLMWIQRLGFFPSICYSLTESLENTDILIITNPDKKWKSLHMQKLFDFLENGSSVLIMVNVQNKKMNVNDFLKNFSMMIRYQEINQSYYTFENNKKLLTTKHAASITGGEPVITTENGDCILTKTAIGNGEIYVFSDSSLFTDSSFGIIKEELSPIQETITQFEFWLFNTIVFKR